MKISNLFILSFLFLSFSFSAFAQKSKSKKKKQEDSTVINFGDEDEKAKSINYLGAIVKISPTSFIVGHFPIEVEKEINNWLSVQGGVGLTFKSVGESQYSALLAEFQSTDSGNSQIDDNKWASDIQDYYYDYTIRNTQVGYRANASARIYFDSDGYEGKYVAPSITLMNNRYQVQKVKEGATSETRLPDDLQQESVRNLDFSIRYGYQVLYPRLAVDYFCGLGVRVKNGTRQDIGYDETSLVRNGEKQVRGSQLLVEFGLRLGFQL